MLTKEPAKVGAFAHGAYRGNYVYIGFALIQNILGTDVLPAEAPIVAAFVLPLYNVYATVLLTVTGNKGGKIKITKILLDVIKNPMILGIVAALPFVALNIEVPFVFNRALTYLGNMSTPLALLIIGATIQLSTITQNLKLILTACFYKLIVQPVIMVGLAIVLGCTSTQILVLYILYGVPSAINVYIVTKKMGGDGDLGAGIIVMTILCSVFTLTLGVFILKTIGII